MKIWPFAGFAARSGGQVITLEEQHAGRATLATWYRDLVTELPVVRQGIVQAPTHPGLGTALRADVSAQADAVVRVSGTPWS